ncbi:hypothetical protein ASF61_03440 [Duganella sp. Leaf126]|uniref:FxDxF family PEP-CTERM protein n=1 Tax=Duganella sp. Leaf126 TaxID=1736266 RepID=UPI000701C166|nr:FxDxF family PEP-CTERM protein [Duganella sp. Leaf126]KQQ47693.1 hypothetical protein ASF61_03440 [Duganella sp. Leaf126]
MKLKFIALAAMLAGSIATGAHAGTINGVTTPDIELKQNSSNPNYWTASFGNVPVNGAEGNFSDVFTFTPVLTSPSMASGAFVNFKLFGFGDLNSVTATLNGKSFTASASQPYLFTLDPVMLGAGPLTLTISGIVSSAGGSYGGNLNVLAVPEPETYGMMLGGLGLLGFMARRRKKN